MKTCPSCNVRFPDALEFCPQDGTQLPGTHRRGATTTSNTQTISDQLIGTVVDGRYKIEAKLGEGGMGVVYAARHVIIDKRFAIKVLKKEAQHEETAGQRFIQEARSASKIGHANIVDITDFGQLPDGSAYFVMEFLEGVTLGQLVAEGPVPAMRAIRVAAQMARGLNAAHKHGVVHRDLKPENIFLIERDGVADVVKIVDFGIAKVSSTVPTAQRLTQAGMVLGTPEYMSPEQATGKETDHRVDEYALGCILYEMLTGEVPFKGVNSAATLTKHVFEAVVPPRKKRPDLAILPSLEAVTLKAMAKRPDERYPSMLELREALDQAALDLPGSVPAGVRRTPREIPPAREVDEDGLTTAVPARRNRTPAMVAVAGGVVLLLGGGGYVLFGRGSEAKHGPAPRVELPPPRVVAAPVEKQKPPPPATVAFTLRTNPEGAAVYLDGIKIGTTPFDYRHPRATRPLGLVFKLAGFKDVSRDLVPDGDHDVEVALVGKRGRDHGHGSHGAARTANASPAAAVPEQQAEQHSEKKARPVTDLRDPFN